MFQEKSVPLFVVSSFMFLAVISLPAVFVTGCGIPPSAHVYGAIMDVKGPVTATSNPIDDQNLRTGSATANSWLGLFAGGDASIATAARNGGITQIVNVDYSSKNFFGLWSSYTVIVYGYGGDNLYGRQPIPSPSPGTEQTEEKKTRKRRSRVGRMGR